MIWSRLVEGERITFISASNCGRFDIVASNHVQNRAFLHPKQGIQASKANCINSVRSDHPFTKRSGDMVYTSVLD
jgi:hypothetical protein